MLSQTELEHLTPVGLHVTIVLQVSSTLAVLLITDKQFGTTAVREEGEQKSKDIARISVLLVGSDGRDMVVTKDREMGTTKVAWEVGSNESLQEMTSHIRWRKWKHWLRSGFYGRILQLQLKEMDKSFVPKRGILEKGRNEQTRLMQWMRRFLLVEVSKVGLLY